MPRRVNGSETGSRGVAGRMAKESELHSVADEPACQIRTGPVRVSRSCVSSVQHLQPTAMIRRIHLFESILLLNYRTTYDNLRIDRAASEAAGV